MDRQNRAVRQDSQNGTSQTGQPEQDKGPDRIAGKGQPERDSQNGTFETGQ